MSLVGLTGTHGTGKSTILRGAKEFGVRVVESSLSRLAQAELGWETLAPAEHSEENMWLLQEQILSSMQKRDDAILGSSEYTLVDRTPVDVISYVDMWCHRLLQKYHTVDPRRVADFRQRCLFLAARYTQHIFVPINAAVPFISEAGRADIQSRDFHEKLVCQFILTNGLNHVVLMSADESERVRRVAMLMNTLQNTFKIFQR